ncbi:myeloid leukemia factor 1 isoform X1 [Scleropages formosus]|uniref:myeloid leukemia factor 1 isoform X1 n=1 Tax=Scleropages formosus TaxID=113540 RepID=UPI000878FBA4|nr:myeloid leukemia factor 1 isoform X1 [Scleropages formosus]
MFNSLCREFDEEDTFFSDPFKAHAELVRKMMRSFSDPFDHNSLPRLTYGQDRALNDRSDGSLVLRQHHKDLVLQNHFRMMDSMLSDMRRNMEQMQKNFENLSADPNTHFFKSSSVMTYSKVGDEPSKVFQAASQTRRAPGGIKETRRSVKDSETGVEKLAIGHHINDRGHVVEKRLNRKTGEREMLQDFQNMDECDAQSFEQEWQQEIYKFQQRAPKDFMTGNGKMNAQKNKRNMGAIKKKAQFEDLNLNGAAVKQ